MESMRLHQQHSTAVDPRQSSTHPKCRASSLVTSVGRSGARVGVAATPRSCSRLTCSTLIRRPPAQYLEGRSGSGDSARRADDPAALAHLRGYATERIAPRTHGRGRT